MTQCSTSAPCTANDYYDYDDNVPEEGLTVLHVRVPQLLLCMARKRCSSSSEFGLSGAKVGSIAVNACPSLPTYRHHPLPFLGYYYNARMLHNYTSIRCGNQRVRVGIAFHRGLHRLSRYLCEMCVNASFHFPSFIINPLVHCEPP